MQALVSTYFKPVFYNILYKYVTNKVLLISISSIVLVC